MKPYKILVTKEESEEMTSEEINEQIAYEQGLYDGWGLARKVISPKEKGGIDCLDLFGKDSLQILRDEKFYPQKILQTIEERKQQEEAKRKRLETIKDDLKGMTETFDLDEISEVVRSMVVERFKAKNK